MYLSVLEFIIVMKRLLICLFGLFSGDFFMLFGGMMTYMSLLHLLMRLLCHFRYLDFFNFLWHLVLNVSLSFRLRIACRFNLSSILLLNLR
jgi:hypothetical protein